MFIGIIFGSNFFIPVCNLSAQRLDGQPNLIEVVTQFEKFVQDTMAQCNAPGAAVAVVKDDRIIYLKGFGVREIGKAEAVDIHTVFRLGSVSKGFAAVLTGVLVQDGILNWDDKIVDYCPDFSLKNAQSTQNLTIRHILSHTTGLPAHTFTDRVEAEVPFEDIVKQLREVQVISPVGKIYAYQNVAFSLIGEVVWAATGQTYQTLIEQRLFEPLGMTDASVGREAFMAASNRAMPHVHRYSGWTVAEIKNAYYAIPPAAGINASILDMAKWLRAVMGSAPQVISQATIREITAPVVRTPQERRRHRWGELLNEAYYGLGWRIFDYGGKKLVYHGGWVSGYRSEIGFIQEDRIGVVVLMNFENVISSYFLPKFFELYSNLISAESYHSSY
ncbi:MAG: beta-lactamase family protein [candidate division KSB1 bacterium]|nr:beta-lactamase family protein [candidate division KSB1 bacterium]